MIIVSEPPAATKICLLAPSTVLLEDGVYSALAELAEKPIAAVVGVTNQYVVPLEYIELLPKTTLFIVALSSAG